MSSVPYLESNRMVLRILFASFWEHALIHGCITDKTIHVCLLIDKMSMNVNGMHSEQHKIKK